MEKLGEKLELGRVGRGEKVSQKAKGGADQVGVMEKWDKGRTCKWDSRTGRNHSSRPAREKAFVKSRGGMQGRFPRTRGQVRKGHVRARVTVTENAWG